MLTEVGVELAHGKPQFHCRNAASDRFAGPRLCRMSYRVLSISRWRVSAAASGVGGSVRIAENENNPMAGNRHEAVSARILGKSNAREQSLARVVAQQSADRPAGLDCSGTEGGEPD